MGPPGESVLAEGVCGASRHDDRPPRRDVQYADPPTTAITRAPTPSPTGLPPDCSDAAWGEPATAESVASVVAEAVAGSATEADVDGAGDAAPLEVVPLGVAATVVAEALVEALEGCALLARTVVGLAAVADGEARCVGDDVAVGVGAGVGSATTGAHSPTG
jgi:hypothetical protein